MFLSIPVEKLPRIILNILNLISRLYISFTNMRFYGFIWFLCSSHKLLMQSIKKGKTNCTQISICKLNVTDMQSSITDLKLLAYVYQITISSSNMYCQFMCYYRLVTSTSKQLALPMNYRVRLLCFCGVCPRFGLFTIHAIQSYFIIKRAANLTYCRGRI